MNAENRVMNASVFASDKLDELDYSAFDEFEQQLDNQLAINEQDLKALKRDFDQIGDSACLGENIKAVVWEQFCNQVATVAGEDFIKENRGMTLDLRDSAHIQTTENFAKGKIASHNTEIDYQQRYDDWQSNFKKDADGNVITHETRTGKREATLVEGARAPFDKARPSGSAERKTDIDHTVSAGEIIRDAEANAHLDKTEQIEFANSDSNLNEMASELNRSKGDKSMSDWLDNPNKKGQKPDEIFDSLTPEEQKRLREKDKQARKEYEKRKKEGEKRSIEAGKKSQKEEALRIGKAELKSVLMRMLADLLKKIVQKLVSWFRSAKSGVASLLGDIKDAFMSFAKDFRTHLVNAADSFATSLGTALVGPIVRVLKKIWTTLKQAWGAVKSAWNYLRDPGNATLPFSVKVMEVGKIVVSALAAMGAVILGQGIEVGLLAIPGLGPFLAIEIPLVGRIAGLLGIFLGAVISGILGAVVINWIQKKIEDKMKGLNLESQVDAANRVLAIRKAQETFAQGKCRIAGAFVAKGIVDRHRTLDAKIAELERKRTIDESFDPHEADDVQEVDEDASRLEDVNRGFRDLLSN